jgi:hypothetical protein
MSRAAAGHQVGQEDGQSPSTATCRPAAPQLDPTQEQFLAAYGTQAEFPDYPAVQAVATAAIAAHCARLAGTTRPQRLWLAASSLNTSTLFGAFKIDPATGAQTSHQTVLLQWTNGDRLTLAQRPRGHQEKPGSETPS